MKSLVGLVRMAVDKELIAQALDIASRRSASPGSTMH